jgi:hypothetical protein
MERDQPVSEVRFLGKKPRLDDQQKMRLLDFELVFGSLIYGMIPEARPRRRWLRRSLFVLYLAIVTLVPLELALRTGWLPNQRFEVLRAIAAERDRPRRLLMLGDSFTIDFEASMARGVAEALRERGFGVLNLAMSGSGPIDYLEQLELAGPVFAPHFVLAHYYAGNDLTDTSEHLRTRGGRIWLRKIVSSTFLGAHLRQLRGARANKSRLDDIEETISSTAARPLNPFLLETARVLPQYINANILIEGSAARAWDDVGETLRRIKARTEELGAKLIIVVIPSTVQVNASHMEFYRNLGFEVDPRVLSSDRPQKLLARFCAEERLDLIDLLPAFRAAQPRELYLDNDDHWNTDGNRLATEVIVRALEELNLLN